MIPLHYFKGAITQNWTWLTKWTSSYFDYCLRLSDSIFSNVKICCFTWKKFKLGTVFALYRCNRHFYFLSLFRLWLKHWEGGELWVRHHPAHLWETHLGQQRGQPVLLSSHRPHLAWAGVGAMATVDWLLLSETVELSVAYYLSQKHHAQQGYNHSDIEISSWGVNLENRNTPTTHTACIMC